MKKFLLLGSIMLVLGLLIVGFVTPIFAHGPDDGGATPDGDAAWEAMHEACENGDWEAMAEAAEEAHGDDFDHHLGDYAPANRWGGMGGHMGRGMMDW